MTRQKKKQAPDITEAVTSFSMFPLSPEIVESLTQPDQSLPPRLNADQMRKLKRYIDAVDTGTITITKVQGKIVFVDQSRRHNF